MANWYEPNAADREEWRAWVESRPPGVRAIAERFFPWTLYRLKSSGHRVTIYSFSEDETLKVNVGTEYNCVVFPRLVFGVAPDDLEECDLPTAGELVGSFEVGFELVERADEDAN